MTSASDISFGLTKHPFWVYQRVKPLWPEITAPEMQTGLIPNLFIIQLIIGPKKLYPPFNDPIQATTDLFESKLSTKGPSRIPKDVPMPSKKWIYFPKWGNN